VTSNPPGFRVFPAIEAIHRVPRSAGVVLIMAISFGVVALNGADLAVGRALEARTDVLAAGQYWRLVTYVLPHDGGWLHVSLNMALLGLYGWQLERIVGTARFLVVYVVSGAVGMALLFSFRSIDTTTGLTGGASLAVFAVVAATGVLYAGAEPTRRKDVIRVATTVVVLLALAGVISMARRRVGESGAAVPTGFNGVVFGVVNHSLGVIGGLLVGGTLLRRGPRHDKKRAVAIVLTVTITAAALATGTLRSPPNSMKEETAARSARSRLLSIQSRWADL
jgi:membrane associated rhomboid family serine protease